MTKLRGKPAPPPRGGQPGWYSDPTNRRRERYWDGNQWTDQFRLPSAAGVTKHAGTLAETPRGTEACLDCGREVGLTARTCPHCGGIHLDIYETGPEEFLLRDIYGAVNTIKAIIVFMFVLWVIGVIVLTIQLASIT